MSALLWNITDLRYDNADVLSTGSQYTNSGGTAHDSRGVLGCQLNRDHAGGGTWGGGEVFSPPLFDNLAGCVMLVKFESDHSWE